jgi:hypothetical protein
MKFVADRAYADPETAARKLLEIANSVEPVQDGRIHIEKINSPMLHDLNASPADYKAGLDLAIEKWLAVAARERHLCKAHRVRRGAVRLTRTHPVGRRRRCAPTSSCSACCSARRNTPKGSATKVCCSVSWQRRRIDHVERSGQLAHLGCYPASRN